MVEKPAPVAPSQVPANPSPNLTGSLAPSLVPSVAPNLQDIKQPVSALPAPTAVAPKKETDITNAHSLPIGILLQAATESWNIPESVQDKVHFIFNNVSQSNMDQKAMELKELLKDENFLKYLAQYLVIKRVSIEHNFHQLYLSFLDRLKITQLYSQLVAQTVENVKVLLKSERITTSIQERSLLKNLGSWLGYLTLAKNKPLLQKDLAVKVRLPRCLLGDDF